MPACVPLVWWRSLDSWLAGLACVAFDVVDVACSVRGLLRARFKSPLLCVLRFSRSWSLSIGSIPFRFARSRCREFVGERGMGRPTLRLQRAFFMGEFKQLPLQDRVRYQRLAEERAAAAAAAERAPAAAGAEAVAVGQAKQGAGPLPAKKWAEVADEEEAEAGAPASSVSVAAPSSAAAASPAAAAPVFPLCVRCDVPSRWRCA